MNKFNSLLLSLFLLCPFVLNADDSSPSDFIVIRKNNSHLRSDLRTLVKPDISLHRSLNSDSCNEEEEERYCKELMESDPTISICECNRPVTLNALPNDVHTDMQYSIERTSLDKAWNITKGTRDIIVAVVDTGIDYTHPDLRNNIWVNRDEIPGNLLDDDQNGYVDDVYGYDFINDDSDPADDHGHGTHVAGIIGAEGNNSLGIAGVNWRSRVMGLKFLNAQGGGNIFDAIKAIHYGLDNGVKVFNFSFGGSSESAALRDAISRAESMGALVVTAAGNKGQDNDLMPEYPANYDLSNIISVGASDSEDNLAWFSNYGAESVDIVAPGDQIISTLPGPGYGILSGTSMAAPYVSGVAALILAEEPSISLSELKERIVNSGDQLTSLIGVVKYQSRLNGYRAVVGDLNSGLAPIPPKHSLGKSGVRIARLKPLRNTKKRRIRNGGLFKGTLKGKPYSKVSLAFQIENKNESVQCRVWNTVLNRRGQRVIRARVPHSGKINKISLSLHPSGVKRSLKVKKVKKRSTVTNIDDVPLSFLCDVLTASVH